MNLDPETKAREIGKDHGITSADWLDISEDNATILLQMIDEGDPEVWDDIPSADLSGQWADGYTMDELRKDCGVRFDADDFDRDADNELFYAYVNGFDEAVTDRVIERCRYYLDEK